jgi:Glycosyl transferase family 2
MLVTASTVKDSAENVSFFVAANLASGVDHMVIFLDAPREPGQPEVAAMLDEHPRVTCIRTGRRTWWQGERPGSLNVRQRINANLMVAALKPLTWAEWLFHIDGDEVACVDREVMAGVPADVDVVRLAPWEAVSEWEATGRPTRFKRLLDDAELTLLHVLGIIPEASNQTYFHGHVMGKSGVRPRSGLALTIHRGIGADGNPAPAFEHEAFKVLHYDGVSGEEFVRKWTALASAGATRYRPSRAPTARALRTLVGRDLPEEVRTRYLRRIYDRTVRDDVEALGELGFLTDLDPVAEPAGPGEPHRGLSHDQAAELVARLQELGEQPKASYLVPDAQERKREDPAGGTKRSLKRLVRGS